MPSKSKAQERTMRAAAHNPDFAEKVGIPVEVAKEFTEADKKRGKKKLPERADGGKSRRRLDKGER